MASLEGWSFAIKLHPQKYTRHIIVFIFPPFVKIKNLSGHNINRISPSYTKIHTQIITSLLYLNMPNKYKRYSKISEAKFKEIIKLYALDIEATKIAHITGISRRTVNSTINQIRQRIVEYCFENRPQSFPDEICCNRKVIPYCKNAPQKTNSHIVFGIYRHNKNIHTLLLFNISRNNLKNFINSPNNIKIHDQNTCLIKFFDAIVDYGYKKHYRVKYSDNAVALGQGKIDDLENFWSLSKNRLAKFRGINKNNFILHLKECEFRYNHRKDNLYKLILKILRENPIEKKDA